jgi:alpha-L-fucosidase
LTGSNKKLKGDFPIEKRLEWFTSARFGMFIHWGLYSILSRGEWVMDFEQIPVAEYELLAKQFNPKKFDADEWAAIAKAAGMKYMVLTTKHHDGFCLFDSKLTDYTSMNAPARCDFVKKYVDACSRANMKIGFYFSILDWHHPACMKSYKDNTPLPEEFVAYARGQIKELCTNYGKIDILWFDGGMDGQWQAGETIEMIRKLQPHIIINDRIGNGPKEKWGDYTTPEQTIPAAALDINMFKDRAWESCMTINNNWGYMTGDDNWKSTRQLIYNLIRCAAGSGNYLLNVGPKADGTIPAPSVKRLKEIGKWLKKNGEAVYGTVRSPLSRNMVSGLVTEKDKKVYVNVYFWGGKEISIAGVKNKVKSAYILSTGKKVKVRQEGEKLFLYGLPKTPPDKYVSVIVQEHN